MYIVSKLFSMILISLLTNQKSFGATIVSQTCINGENLWQCLQPIFYVHRESEFNISSKLITIATSRMTTRKPLIDLVKVTKNPNLFNHRATGFLIEREICV